MRQTVVGINDMVEVKVQCRPYRVVHVATDDIVVVVTVHLRTESPRQGTHKILRVERESLLLREKISWGVVSLSLPFLLPFSGQHRTPNTPLPQAPGPFHRALPVRQDREIPVLFRQQVQDKYYVSHMLILNAPVATFKNKRH